MAHSQIFCLLEMEFFWVQYLVHLPFFFIPNLPDVVTDEIDLYLFAHDSNCLFSQYKAEEMSMPLSARWNHG